MAQSRQLAAIMFTDIAGYTALMGQDEQKAFELLHRSRQVQQTALLYGLIAVPVILKKPAY